MDVPTAFSFRSWAYIASFITAFISLQVGDFGLSRIKRNTLVSGGVRGTLPWMAPELLNGSSSRVSEKVSSRTSVKYYFLGTS